MKKKIFSLIMITVLLSAAVFLTSESDWYYASPTKEIPLYLSSGSGVSMDYMPDEIHYDVIERTMEKKGTPTNFEMGLYWRRKRLQRDFYTDVQEICEDVFGDYLSPLQGLCDIVSDMGYDGARYRTDKESAILGPGSVQFYLFLKNFVALVNIEDAGENYHTTFRILKEEELHRIRVLEVPPPGGIGIAGIPNSPEKQNYDTHKVVTNEKIQEYSKADIQLVFREELQAMTEDIFGDYVQSLQGAYMLIEQEGYGSENPFMVESLIDYRLYPSYRKTVVIEENFCEFTLNLNNRDRARVAITKEGDQYITTMRLLKTGEFETEPMAG